jgi:alpha-beta hydrolase superfamily lysophospholipase
MMIKTSRQTLSSQTPFFLLGHSMGGLIVLNYAQQNGEK